MAEKIEYIEAVDKLDEGRKKINDFAIAPALRAEQNSVKAGQVSANAVEIAQKAKDESRNVQEQLTQITVEGDSSVEAAQARVAEDGTVYPSLKDRLDKHNTEVEVEGSGVREVFLPALEALKSQINIANFNLGINTDCHYEDTQNLSQYPNAGYGLSHAQNILYCGDVLDAIVFAGDNVHGDALNLDAVKKQQQTFADLALNTNAGCDVFLTIGNHDDGGGRKRTTLIGDTLTYADIIHDAEFKKYYRTSDLLFDEARDADSLYCFKDYPEKGIRLIVLNSSDIPENITETDSLKLKYLRFLTHSYSQAQFSWLCNVALRDVPEDYHVIAVQHTPLKFGWDLSPSLYFNHDLTLGILKAFRDGTSYAGVSANTDFPAVVNVDFSDQGPRAFCGVFSGHLHNQKNYLIDGINNSTLLNSVADNDNRVIGTVGEDAFSILEIDKQSRKIRIHGFGSATDREIEY